MNIGDRIQRCRKERGWTQKQLAEKSGVPQAAISKIERGQVKPLFETVYRIAGAFGMGMDELAGIPASKSGKKTELDPTLLSLLKANPALADALKNPEIAKLVKELPLNYPHSATKKDILALLKVASRMLDQS